MQIRPKTQEVAKLLQSLGYNAETTGMWSDGVVIKGKLYEIFIEIWRDNDDCYECRVDQLLGGDINFVYSFKNKIDKKIICKNFESEIIAFVKQNEHLLSIDENSDLIIKTGEIDPNTGELIWGQWN